MPSLTEIVNAVTTFVSDNIALVAGAVIVGLMAAVLSRLIRSGR